MSKNLAKLAFVLIFVFLLSACAKSPAPAASTTQPKEPTKVATTTASTAPTKDQSGYPAPSNQQSTVPAAQSAYPASESANLITVIKKDKSTRDITKKEFDSLPKSKVKNLEGPKLEDVLKLAGVTSFNKLILSSGATNLTLLKSDLSNPVILVNSGMAVTVVGQNIPEPNWNAITHINIVE